MDYAFQYLMRRCIVLGFFLNTTLCLYPLYQITLETLFSSFEASSNEAAAPGRAQQGLPTYPIEVVQDHVDDSLDHQVCVFSDVTEAPVLFSTASPLDREDVFGKYGFDPENNAPPPWQA
jgi:hypothetical protein